MIKHCFLYKATPRGSKAKSSRRRCREEGEAETESGTGTGMGTRTGVGRESRIVEQNPICETERETERDPKRKRNRKRNGKRNGIRNGKRNGKRNGIRNGKRNGSRKRGPERRSESLLRTGSRGKHCMGRRSKSQPDETYGIPEYSLLRADLQSGGMLASIYTRSTHNPDLYPRPPSSRSIHSTHTLPRYPQSVPL